MVGENKEKGWVTPYTPPAYSSTTEVNTGRKWVNGKDIYELYFTGTFPTITETSTQNLLSDLELEYLIDTDLFVEWSQYSIFKMSNNITYSNQTKILAIVSISQTYSSKSFYGIVRYTKPDPVPPEPTPEFTKKKKTTK